MFNGTILGIPDKEPTCSAGDTGEEMWVQQPTPALLPRESHGQRSLVGYSLWGCTELDTTESTHTHTHTHTHTQFS